MSTESAAALSKNLRTLSSKLKSHAQGTKFSDSWSWQAMSLDKNDLSYMATIIANRLDSVDWSKADESVTDIFEDLAPKVENATQHAAANLFAGPQASEVIAAFLYSVHLQVDDQFTAGQLKASLLVPATLARGVTAANQRLQEATASLADVEEKIQAINNAYEAAEDLPITKAELASALGEIENIKAQVSVHEQAAKASADAANTSKFELDAAKSEALGVLTKVHDAYRAATSQGLAQEFSKRSKSLNNSIALWVMVLIAALVAAGCIGHIRFPQVLAALSGTPDWGTVLANILISALSLAPAVWLAWVATKQVGQRFRLAEDYSYKAALSAAYEGYRNEAEQLDPMFQAQLFATALTRLNEIPLRHLEQAVPGSPLHELLGSSEFREALEHVPTLRDKVMAILNPRGDAMKLKSPTKNDAGKAES
jgi:hypothetical protein